MRGARSWWSLVAGLTLAVVGLVPAGGPTSAAVVPAGLGTPAGVAGAVSVSSPTPTSVSVAGSSGFSDVPVGAPFYTEVSWLASAGISTGYADGTFHPLEAVSRQAMAAFLYRYAGSPAYPAPATARFTDVPTSHPFYMEISWLADQGITTGYADGSFHPTESVSRQAMAAFLYRYANRPTFTAPGSASFGDVPIGVGFFTEIEWLASTGITTGYADHTFHPTEDVSRQAMAAFLYRYDRRDTTAPGSVTDLAFAATTSSTITLSWTNPTDPDFAGVVIRRLEGPFPPVGVSVGEAVADLGAAATSFTDTGLTPGVGYSYGVFAHDDSGNLAAATGRTAATVLDDPVLGSGVPAQTGVVADGPTELTHDGWSVAMPSAGTGSGQLSVTVGSEPVSADAMAAMGLVPATSVAAVTLTSGQPPAGTMITTPVPASVLARLQAAHDAGQDVTGSVLLAYHDPDTGDWEPITTSVDLATGTATASTDHFTDWALFWDTAAQTMRTLFSGGVADRPSCPQSAPIWFDRAEYLNTNSAPVFTCFGGDPSDPDLLVETIVNNRGYGMWVIPTLTPTKVTSSMPDLVDLVSWVNRTYADLALPSDIYLAPGAQVSLAFHRDDLPPSPFTLTRIEVDSATVVASMLWDKTVDQLGTKGAAWAAIATVYTTWKCISELGDAGTSFDGATAHAILTCAANAVSGYNNLEARAVADGLGSKTVSGTAKALGRAAKIYAAGQVVIDAWQSVLDEHIGTLSTTVYWTDLLHFTTTDPLPAATLDVPYSITFAATGGTPPYTYGLASTPPNIGLDNWNAGTWSGTPTTTGTYPITIQATDHAGQTLTKTYHLTIRVPGGAVSGTGGDSWAMASLASPPGGGYAWLQDSACSFDGLCMIVGYGQDSMYNTRPQVEMLIDGTWYGQWLPTPPDLAPDGEAEARVMSVDCASRTYCVAVGAYQVRVGSGGDPGLARGFAAVFDGSGWTAVVVPDPPDSIGSTSLEGVACVPQSTDCAAVGSYGEPVHGGTGLVADIRAGVVSAEAPPSPAGAYNGVNFDESQTGSEQISCNEAGSCFTAATYSTIAAPLETQHVIETYHDGAWTQAPAALPGDASSDGRIEQGVQCGPVSTCIWTGWYIDVTGAMAYYVQTFDGAWHVERAPNPPGDQSWSLGQGACDESGACFFVQHYSDISSGLYEYHSVIEKQSATGWSAEEIPLWGGSPVCWRGGSCAFFGSFYFGGPYSVETSTPSGWLHSTITLPSDAVTTTLNYSGLGAGAVSCSWTGTCVGIGGYPARPWGSETVMPGLVSNVS